MNPVRRVCRPTTNSWQRQQALQFVGAAARTPAGGDNTVFAIRQAKVAAKSAKSVNRGTAGKSSKKAVA
ncbi:MAG TPA: hypothetical protein VG897_14315 [Terriglobales bacterium]|jgi:hypothetical protein|nr:hypothetical protein [Terriglobales bacterium]